MHNSIRKYFVGNLVTAAPPQYSSAIRLCLSPAGRCSVTDLLHPCFLRTSRGSTPVRARTVTGFRCNDSNEWMKWKRSFIPVTSIVVVVFQFTVRILRALRCSMRRSLYSAWIPFIGFDCCLAVNRYAVVLVLVYLTWEQYVHTTVIVIALLLASVPGMR